MPEYRENNLQDLGKQVRQKREEQGLSLKDVYEGTKIRIQFLEGIEKGDFSEFPGTVYVRGFIRTYLQFIEMEHLWQEYLPVLSGSIVETAREQQEEEPAIVGKCAPPTKGFKSSSPFWIFVILLLVAFGSSWYVWYTWDQNGVPSFTITQNNGDIPKNPDAPEIKDEKDQEQPKPSENPGPEKAVEGEKNNEAAASGPAKPESAEGETPPEGIKTPPTVAELVGAPEAETPPAAEAKKDKELVITADGDCWVRVRQGTKTLYERTIKAGDKVSFTVQARIEVTYGRAGSVKTRWNGKDLGNPGATKGVEKVFYAPDGTTGTVPR
ncbi:MAG: helix-turn-helix domain-containing protein [Synergistaceae bacterium]|nr:helix-turn-helix domain-containing protein [Synergistaceae bacterium]